MEEPESSRGDEYTDEFLELIHVGKEAVPLRAVGDDDESLQRKERSSHIYARYHRTDVVMEHLFHRVWHSGSQNISHKSRIAKRGHQQLLMCSEDALKHRQTPAQHVNRF